MKEWRRTEEQMKQTEEQMKQAQVQQLAEAQIQKIAEQWMMQKKIEMLRTQDNRKTHAIQDVDTIPGVWIPVDVEMTDLKVTMVVQMAELLQSD